jgi:DNA-binding IclR family transcriptional regulator
LSREKKRKQRTVNSSSELVFAVLRQISCTQRPLGAAELHRIIGEPMSSTHRALMTLEEAGLAARVGSNAKFGPGPMAYHAIRAMIARFPIRKRGLHLLKEIVHITNGVATLNARVGWFSLLIGWAEGRREFYHQRRIGEARLLHTDAAPLSMLATMDDEMIAAYREDVVRRWPSEARQALSPVLERTLAAARRSKYVAKPDALRAGRYWVAVPIRTPGGIAAASVMFDVRDADLPKRRTVPRLFLEATELIAAFQSHLNSHPEEIASPYDSLKESKVHFDLPARGDPFAAWSLDE